MGIQMAHRGASMAAGRCPRGRLKIWVGTVVRSTTTRGGALWSGGQVKQRHGPSMVRATSIRTVIRETRACVPLGRLQDASRGSGLLSWTSSRGGIGPGQGVAGVSSRWPMVSWALSGQGYRLSCGFMVLGTGWTPRATGLPSTC